MEMVEVVGAAEAEAEAEQPVPVAAVPRLEA